MQSCHHLFNLVSILGVQKSLKIVFFSSAARRQGARWEGQSKRQKRWCFYGYKSKVETPSISVENYWSPSYSHSNKMEQEKVIFKIRTDWPVLLGRRRMPFNTLLTKENRSSCLILQIRGRYFWYFQPFFFRFGNY